MTTNMSPKTLNLKIIQIVVQNTNQEKLFANRFNNENTCKIYLTKPGKIYTTVINFTEKESFTEKFMNHIEIFRYRVKF